MIIGFRVWGLGCLVRSPTEHGEHRRIHGLGCRVPSTAWKRQWKLIPKR